MSGNNTAAGNVTIADLLESGNDMQVHNTSLPDLPDLRFTIPRKAPPQVTKRVKKESTEQVVVRQPEIPWYQDSSDAEGRIAEAKRQERLFEQP